MSKRMLPEKDSSEALEIERFYSSASQDKLREWADKYEFSDVASFMTSVSNRLGLKRRDGLSKNQEPDREPVVVNLPPVNLIKRKSVHHNGDEEVMILIAGDGHAGKITRSFNKEVYRDRMENIFKSTMILAELHRHMYPINKLHIIDVGDNCQGENPFQGSTIGSTEMGARDQVKKLAAPMWNDLLGSFKQEFDEVEFDGFAGNHGHDRLAPETSSLDLMLYDVLEAGIGQQKGIKINTHEEFGDVININGFRFFCFHGDGIPCTQGIPYFALNKKLLSWFLQYHSFQYAVSGHFHKRHSEEVASRIEHFMCGSLVSDDEWALKKLGISSNPSQWVLGVHPRRGVTWRYALAVDDKFLPDMKEG